MTSIEVAAEVLELLDRHHTGPDEGRAPTYLEQAEALADAGLLAEHMPVADGDMVLFRWEQANPEIGQQLTDWFNDHGKRVLVICVKPDVEVSTWERKS